MVILPKPKETLYGIGEVQIRRGCMILPVDDETRFCAELLQEEFYHATGMRVEIAEKEEADTMAVVYCKESGMRGEQYRLCIAKEQIELCAGSKAGFLYATQTMRQIVRQCGATLPIVTITDEPDISVRGVYHDVTRGRVPTLAYLKKLADTCAFYKINQLQLYVEHTYLFRTLGGLFSDRDPLTAEDIRSFDVYCKERNIELVPSLSSFGHLYELLRTKQYAHLCELSVDLDEPFSFYDRMAHHTLDVSNPESEMLMRNLIGEYAALFISDKFNICADETFDLGKGKNKVLAEGVGGTTALYMDFLGKLCRIVKESGKTPMFWGDILQEFPEKSSLLPEDTICLYWNYEPDAKDDKLKGLVTHGIKNLYVCPGVHGWNHLINRYDHAYANIAKMCEFAKKYHAQGVLVTDWGDYGHINHPEFSVAGFIYAAAFSWNTEILPKDVVDDQISAIEFGDRSGRVMESVNALSMGEDITWGQLVCKKEQRPWDQFVPEEDIERRYCLRAAIQDGYRLLGSVAESQRERYAAYLLAAEGQELLNCAWHMINHKERPVPENVQWSYEAATISKKLRLWYRDYQKLWRSVSRESELARVGEVIFWYAGQLEQ